MLVRMRVVYNPIALPSGNHAIRPQPAFTSIFSRFLINHRIFRLFASYNIYKDTRSMQHKLNPDKRSRPCSDTHFS